MPEILTPSGAVIHYHVDGPTDGQPMLLIEGLSAHLIGWHDDFCTLLIEAGFRVIRFDNRDAGLSQKYPGIEYSLGDLAADTYELISGLGLASVHVVGQSMGGMVAQSLAVRYPSVVRSLALLYTAASASHFVGSDRDVESLSKLPRSASRDEAVARYVEQERACASTKFPFDEEWKAELGGLMWDRCYCPEGVVRQRAALESVAVDMSQLARIDVPTTIIHGSSDRLISESGSREIHGTIKGSELWIVDGMGHELPRPIWKQIVQRIIRNARLAKGLKENSRVG